MAIWMAASPTLLEAAEINTVSHFQIGQQRSGLPMLCQTQPSRRSLFECLVIGNRNQGSEPVR